MATARKPVVEVRRSERRRRTVSAYRDGERVVVLIPGQFSRAEEREWVDRMLERLAARDERTRRTDTELTARAKRLAQRYLTDYPAGSGSRRGPYGVEVPPGSAGALAAGRGPRK